MSPPLSLFLIVLIGFGVYFLVRDWIFQEVSQEAFHAPPPMNVPSPASIVIRQEPTYSPRDGAVGGPSTPSHAPPSDEVVVYGPPQATDPYDERQESSEIPETLRHPERSYRPAPAANHTRIAVESGIAQEASPSSSSDASIQSSVEMIQNGSEFMSGVYANDTFQDSSYSAF